MQSHVANCESANHDGCQSGDCCMPGPARCFKGAPKLWLEFIAEIDHSKTDQPTPKSPPLSNVLYQNLKSLSQSSEI